MRLSAARGQLQGGAALVFVVAVAGCGGVTTEKSVTGSPSVVARVCMRTLSAAMRVLGPPVRMRIAPSDPSDIECVAIGRRLTADMEAQASPRAWTQYDTTSVHLVQAFGSGSVHDRSHLPRQLSGVAPEAMWVPAQGELVATNGTPSAGGTYLTVTVTGRGSEGAAGLALARAVARATVPIAPRGPSPGQPPS